jgi:hypothetical protein
MNFMGTPFLGSVSWLSFSVFSERFLPRREWLQSAVWSCQRDPMERMSLATDIAPVPSASIRPCLPSRSPESSSKLANPAILPNGRYCDKRNARTEHDTGEKIK